MEKNPEYMTITDEDGSKKTLKVNKTKFYEVFREIDGEMEKVVVSEDELLPEDEI